METVVLDTSVFTNSASGNQFWRPKHKSNNDSPDLGEILVNFLKLAQKTPTVKYIITPGVYNELFVYKGGSNQKPFIDSSKIPKNLLILLEVVSPNPNGPSPPRSIFVKLIQEFRTREDSAEKMIVSRVSQLLDMPQNEKHDKKQVIEIKKIRKEMENTTDVVKKMKLGGTLIRNARESHREHMRVGLIDSETDIETIFVAHDYNALLVASDEGIIKWSQIIAPIRTLPYDQLRSWMESRIGKK